MTRASLHQIISTITAMAIVKTQEELRKLHKNIQKLPKLHKKIQDYLGEALEIYNQRPETDGGSTGKTVASDILDKIYQEERKLMAKVQNREHAYLNTLRRTHMYDFFNPRIGC